MFNWFRHKPLLEEGAAQWLWDCFSWCETHFDEDFFRRHSVLVIPSNRHFPGRADSPHAMAELIFQRVKHYAGMSHWPCVLVGPDTCLLDETPRQVLFDGPLRGKELSPRGDAAQLPIGYDPRQVNNPEALIASCAHGLAYYLSLTAPQAPPGDAGHQPYAAEMLAIFMGFGLMFANSAFTFQGGCGSCQTVGRAAYLSEFEATYALAIFCAKKRIIDKEVTPYLKRHLRGFYKRAAREVAQRLDGQ